MGFEPVLALQLDWDLVRERLLSPEPQFWGALAATVYIAVISEVIGVLLGLLTVLWQRSRYLPLRVLSYTYQLVIRGTPVIVQIFFVFFGASLFLGFDLFPQQLSFWGVAMSGAALAGIVALSINEGAYMSEIIRAGIDAIDRGQMEAAKAVGMRHRLAMRRIILPQAARVIVPPLGNQFNNMLKTTSLLAFIGVTELFQDAQQLYSTSFQPVEIFLAVAVWYLLLTTIWTLIQVQIERKLGASDRLEDESWIERILGTQARAEGAR